MSPPSFPRTCPCPGAPFPSQGPSGRFPRFLGTSKHSDFLPPLPRCSVSSVPPRVLGFVPARLQDATAAGLELFTGIPKTGFIGGDDRTSQVPGEPQYERALLFDPGGTVVLDRYRTFGVVFRHLGRRRLPQSPQFRGSITRPVHSMYASQGGSPHRHARLASGWLASLVQAGLTTRWVLTKGFRSSHPPFPGFAWRTNFIR